MKAHKIISYLSLIFFFLIVFTHKGLAQEAEDKIDSLYAARLMQDNLGLYDQLDSLNRILKDFNFRNTVQRHQLDSLETELMQQQARLLVSGVESDTLASKNLRLKQDFLHLKKEMLVTGTQLEEKLQMLRDKEFQLVDCEAKLRDARSQANLDQAKLEGRIDVNTTKVEAKDREILYLKESIVEKDRIILEKSSELSVFYRDKSSSLRIIDSLSRVLNSKELELVRVSERLRIIEGQYNEMVAQKTAAQNKKKKVRFVQGVALKGYRTPDWQLAPESSATTAVYVISNKNSGKLEFDYITGVSLSLYDLTQPDGKYTYDAGMFVGFGGTNLFKNFYVAPSFKAFDFFHFMIGLNIAEYQQLKTGFNEGDPLPPGMSIPTVKEWKANAFFGMTIDFELLSNIPKKM